MVNIIILFDILIVQLIDFVLITTLKAVGPGKMGPINKSDQILMH